MADEEHHADQVEYPHEDAEGADELKWSQCAAQIQFKPRLVNIGSKLCHETQKREANANFTFYCALKFFVVMTLENRKKHFQKFHLLDQVLLMLILLL